MTDHLVSSKRPNRGSFPPRAPLSLTSLVAAHNGVLNAGECYKLSIIACQDVYSPIQMKPGVKVFEL